MRWEPLGDATPCSPVRVLKGWHQRRCSAKSPSFGDSVVSSAQERHALTGKPLLTALWIFRAGTSCYAEANTDRRSSLLGQPCLGLAFGSTPRRAPATPERDPDPIHAPRRPTRASPGRSCPPASHGPLLWYEDLALNGRSRDTRRMAWPVTRFALGSLAPPGPTRRDRNCRHRA